MMMKELDNRLAVVQFGGTEDPDLKELAQAANIHWYVFDEDADKAFEINHLKDHYAFIFVCLKGKEKELKKKPKEMAMEEAIVILGNAANNIGITVKELMEAVKNWKEGPVL